MNADEIVRVLRSNAEVNAHAAAMLMAADLIESLQAQLAEIEHKKGRWVRCRGEILNWECSACGFPIGEPWHDPNMLGRLAYCSHCGCEMPAVNGPRLKAEAYRFCQPAPQDKPND